VRSGFRLKDAWSKSGMSCWQELTGWCIGRRSASYYMYRSIRKGSGWIEKTPLASWSPKCRGWNCLRKRKKLLVPLLMLEGYIVRFSQYFCCTNKNVAEGCQAFRRWSRERELAKWGIGLSMSMTMLQEQHQVVTFQSKRIPAASKLVEKRICNRKCVNQGRMQPV